MKLKVKRFLKKNFIRFFQNKKYLNNGISCKKQWHGNEYGGFYLNPDFVSDESIVYSFGIGEDISFDLSLIETYNCDVFGFDPTPKSIKWIKSRGVQKKFSFFSFGIGCKNEKVNFFLPKDENFVSGSIINRSELSVNNHIEVQLKNLKTIAQELNHSKIHIIKMDIEGSEYDVVESLFDANLEFDQILVEFHDRFFENGVQKTKDTISFLRNKGFEIFAISDSFEEISFINKALLEKGVNT